MRALIGTVILLPALAIAGAVTARGVACDTSCAGAVHHRAVPAEQRVQAQHDGAKRTLSPVAVRVDAGYGGEFRSGSWIPVRITLHNRTSTTVDGTVELGDPNGSNGGSVGGHGVYQQAVVLPAGSTKQVTLYLPAGSTSTVPGGVTAVFRDGDGHSLGSNTFYPSPLGDTDLSFGMLTSDPLETRWVRNLNLQTFNLNLVRLTTTMLDPVPEALANFDVIVLSNFDSTSLDAAQKTALERWVRGGGSLVLVGGPSWQETLGSLPASLIPGRLVGSTTVSGPTALHEGTSSPAAGVITVSFLRQPHGIVVAQQNGAPLIIRDVLGQGTILYLAFDPSLNPVAHWSRGPLFMAKQIEAADPTALTRFSLPSGFQQPFWAGGQYGPVSIASELTNVPAAALPSLILFIILTIAFVVLLGPINFIVLRRLRRRELTWVTIPVLAAVCVGSTFGVAFHLKGNTVLINSVGIVQLSGDAGSYPASIYAGLFAPVRGDYHLSYNAPALPEMIPQFDYYSPGPPSNPLTMQFEEGSDTRITFLSMNMWSMREVALHTSVSIPGTLAASLHLDSTGAIVGTLHNGTNLDLVHSVILAGRAVRNLPEVPAGATIAVRITPASDPHDHSPITSTLFNQPSWGGPRYFVKPVFGRGVGLIGVGVIGGPAGCCSGPLQPQENTFADRIRNAGTFLPDMQRLASSGEVVFIGWTQQSLGSISVDGVTPHRRDLTAIVSPLSVGLMPGVFQLRHGTFGARLVQITPGSPSSNNCCPWGPWERPIVIGASGQATFAFDLPQARSVHLRQLTLSVDAGGPYGTGIGSVYDVQNRRWVSVDLSSPATLAMPQRFVSSAGEVLLRLRATNNSGDILIADPHQNIQLSGSGWVA